MTHYGGKEVLGREARGIMIREAVEKLVGGESLGMEEASVVMREVMDGEATPAQLSAFLVALRIKGETAEEMAGMAAVMREKAIRVEAEGLLVDTAGTGGDGKGTFNISTAASFVAAGAGVKISKHGNRAASGSCGSADVLEELGVAIELGPAEVKRCIEEVGMGFMFAPAYHPAMRHAVPVRRELGIRTVFNFLGPLTCPAGAQNQLVGTPNAQIAEKMAQVLLLLGSRHSMVVHGEDGLDELTLGGDTLVWEVRDGAIRHYRVSPSDAGLDTSPTAEVQGGDRAANARILREVCQGGSGPARDVVLLNAAAMLVVGDAADSLAEGVEAARTAIDNGAAIRCVDDLVSLSQRLAKESAPSP